MTGDRDAAQNDDAEPALDFVEDLREIGIERRVAAMLGADVAEPEPGFLHARQHLFEGGAVPRRQIEGDPVLGQFAAAPRHRMIDFFAMDRGHRCSSSAAWRS